MYKHERMHLWTSPMKRIWPLPVQSLTNQPKQMYSRSGSSVVAANSKLEFL